MLPSWKFKKHLSPDNDRENTFMVVRRKGWKYPCKWTVGWYWNYLKIFFFFNSELFYPYLVIEDMILHADSPLVKVVFGYSCGTNLFHSVSCRSSGKWCGLWWELAQPFAKQKNSFYRRGHRNCLKKGSFERREARHRDNQRLFKGPFLI